jgi:FkbM family methyltransferase
MNTTDETDFPGDVFLRDIPKNNVLLEEVTELNSDSLVVDIGCYDSTWLHKMHSRYSCRCIGVEPLVDKYNIGKNRDSFINNEKVRLFNYGISVDPLHEKGVTLKGKADGTKIYPTSERNLDDCISSLIKTYSCTKQDIEIVDMKHAKNFFEEIGSPIDVLTINIEGAEYELVPFMISNHLLENVKCIQIQFHPIDVDSKEKMCKIISDLKSFGYKQKFNYEFVWFAAVKD